MTGFWEGLTGLEKVYFTCAATGGLLFTFWLVMQFLGGGDHGADADVGGDVGHGDVSHGDGSLDPSFKVVSLHGITSFFTMFGLVGLALSKQEASAFISTAGGMFAGFLMVWAMGYLFAAFMKLQSSGTLDMRNAIGQEGTVYLSIPEEGTGKAQVTVQGRLQVFNAVSERKQAIPTGERVKVVRVVGGDTVSVVKM